MHLTKRVYAGIIPLLLSWRLLCLSNEQCSVPDRSLLANCYCDIGYDRTLLEIDCAELSLDSTTQANILILEIEALLANNTQLKGIRIINAQLTQIPAVVCDMSTSLKSLTLNYNNLSALPDNCLLRLKQLIVFSVEDNFITRLQDGLFNGLVLLEQMSFKNNRIKSVGPRVFSKESDLRSLRWLDFSNNKLTSIDLWPPIQTDMSNAINAEIKNTQEPQYYIYLHDNLLTKLPRGVTTFSYHSFSIYNNPLDCSCDQVWFRNWLKIMDERGILENDQGIICNTPSSLFDKSIWDVTVEEMCPASHYVRNIVIVVTVVTVVPLLCIAGVMLIRHILHVYRVESYKRFRFHPFDRDECAGKEMTYDVFISYAHEDSNLARELLEFLESNGFVVCFHQRDFLPGEPVMENILEAVYKSKRVLCLVTANFLQSRYCLDKFNMAQTRNVELKKRRLIIVKYEEFHIGAQVDAGRTNEGEEPNQAENCGDLEAQQLLIPNTSTCTVQREGGANRHNGLVLRDFVTRHTFINLSAADSWRDQLLYAMPISRLGTSDSSTPGLENN